VIGRYLNNQILNRKFCKEFAKIEEGLEKEGDDNPLNVLYAKSEASELGQVEKRGKIEACRFAVEWIRQNCIN
jgi:hypothetical protein